MHFFSVAYFSGVVKVLYNLLYYQVILQISCNFSRAERNTILKRRYNCATTPSETILAQIIEYFSDSGLYSGTDDDKPSTSSSPTYAKVKTHCIEQQVCVSNCIILFWFINFFTKRIFSNILIWYKIWIVLKHLCYITINR